jgi:hypothetical protein
MNSEEIRWPPREEVAPQPSGERRPTDDQPDKDGGEAPSFAFSPPPLPWPRVFPSL